MEILAPGSVSLDDDCVVLMVADMQYTMVWPAERTAWDGERIQFETLAGETVPVEDGQEVNVVGGPLDGNWMESVDWVNRPQSDCHSKRGWRVYDIES